MEFCLILTKYCVKTNSDGVIFQTLIEKIVKAPIGHDIPGVFLCHLQFLNIKLTSKQQTNESLNETLSTIQGDKIFDLIRLVN